MGGKLSGDYQYLNAIDDSGRLYDVTGQAIAALLKFIRAVSHAAKTNPSISERIMVVIGDDIGDDILQMYLSSVDQQRVMDYLLAEKLTT